MLDGNSRREQIIAILKESDSPISATNLARQFNVSRQIVVGDIALIRAQGLDINATPRGYVFPSESRDCITRTIACLHEGEDSMLNELNAIVDMGCKVLDVIVDHPVYGQISGQLQISSRNDVNEFVERVKTEKAHSLSELTDGIHLHTVECPNEEVYVNLVKKLIELGILFED